MSQEPFEQFDFGMTDLEERLRAPGGREVAEAILARLDARLAALHSELNAGVSLQMREDFDIVVSSIAAAKEVMVIIAQTMRDASATES